MKPAAIFVLIMALAFLGLTMAQGKPDFSGTWTLDVTKSDIGQGRPTAAGAPKVTIVIKQTATILATERKAGERTETATHKLDGSECINKSPSGQDIKSRSQWVGSTLVTNSIMSTAAGTSESSDVRSLSTDGKVMTIEMTQKTARGETRRKLVYNKE